MKRATTEPVEMALLADETSSFQKATAHGQQVCRDCGFSASSAADGGYLGFRHQSTQRATHQGESTIVLLRTDRAGHSEAIVEHEGWKIDGDSTRVASGPVVSTDGAHAITAWYSAVPKPNVIVMMSTDRGRTFRGWRVGADGPARDFTSSWSGGTATVAWVETGTDGTFLRAMRLGRNTVWGPGSLMEVESGTIPTLVSVSGATYLYRSGRDGRGTLVRLRTEPPDTPPEL